MNHECLTRSVAGGTLHSVPSVHFRLCFAEEVNRLAGQLRPAAIAVELGPAAAAAATEWLRELGMGPSRRTRVELPCMLGLTWPNRLRSSNVSVLYLSPTDSIIEAIRCALELDVPLYGVDLEEWSDDPRPEIMLEEPASTAGRPFRSEDFAARNSAYAERQRDAPLDSRRELAMAARLHALVARHGRVLFVCGLAHWRPLDQLLAQADLQPEVAVPPTPEQVQSLARVVVHPLLAVHHLDALPLFAQEYEQHRPHAAASRTIRQLDMPAALADKLQATYADYFSRSDSGQQLDRKLEDLEARGDFEQLLRNLCTVRLQSVPDLFAALVSAQGVMSEGFCRTLADKLMEFPWAEPNDFPGLPLLAPAPTSAGAPLRAEFVGEDGQRSPYFYIQALPGGSEISAHVPIPWKWNVEPPPPVPSQGRTGSRSNWVPLDDLMSAMALRAMRLARDHAEQPRTELFEGSLLGGVDLKSTLRAVTRGDDRIYVRAVTRRRQSRANPHDDDGFPFVWILRLPADEQMTWSFSSDSMITLRPHAADAARFDEVARNDGNTLISAAIATGSEQREPELCQPGYEVVSLSRFGQLNFNPLPSVSRTAEWAERTDFCRGPIVAGGSFPALARAYRERFGIELGQFAWPVTLVQMAIPYAARAVTVVAPDGFTLPAAVYRQAASRPTPVEVRMVPLSFFPAQALRKISKIYWIPTLGRTPKPHDLPIYPEHVKRHFGEDVEIYRRLIPKDWH